MVIKSYHDYVFKEGKLIGNFESMYQESDIIPWHQDKTASYWFSDIAISVLKANAPYECAIDIGCGMGYFTSRLQPICQTVVGVDISSTAIQKAQNLFPDIEFSTGDIRSEEFDLGQFDLVIAKDILWYVFNKLDVAIENLAKTVKLESRLLIFQSFPNLESSFVGKEKISSPDILLDYLSRYFSLEISCTTQRHSYAGEGPMVVYLLRRNF